MNVPLKEGNGLGEIKELIEIGSVLLVDEFVDGLDVVEVSFSDEEIVADT